MRLIHTSDWHLGRTFHGEDLYDAHQLFVDWLVIQVREQQADALVISGDVFDSAFPPARSIAQFTDALAQLAQATHVIVTPGNHDSAVRVGYLAPLLRDEVTVFSRVDQVGQGITIVGRDGHDAVIYPIPYLDPSDARRILAEDTDEDGHPVALERSHSAVMAAAMRRIRADISRRTSHSADSYATVVMAHAFVVGGASSESERNISVGGIEYIPADVFDGVDYVALGHLHGPQTISMPTADTLNRPVLRYSGSPVAYSFSEIQHHKSITVVDVQPGIGVTKLETIATPVLRPLGHFEGSLGELLSDRHANLRDHWMRIWLTDDRVEPSFLATIKHTFPHALQVLRRPANTSDSQPVANISPNVDPTDVVANFIEYVTSSAAGDDELALVRDIVAEYDRSLRNS